MTFKKSNFLCQIYKRISEFTRYRPNRVMQEIHKKIRPRLLEKVNVCKKPNCFYFVICHIWVLLHYEMENSSSFGNVVHVQPVSQSRDLS